MSLTGAISELASTRPKTHELRSDVSALGTWAVLYRCHGFGEAITPKSAQANEDNTNSSSINPEGAGSTKAVV